MFGLLSERAQILDAASVAGATAQLWTLPCVVIKTDDEPAILSLKEEMMRRLECGAIPVESAPENEAKLFKLCSGYNCWLWNAS